jgi:hypothetical protein
MTSRTSPRAAPSGTIFLRMSNAEEPGWLTRLRSSAGQRRVSRTNEPFTTPLPFRTTTYLKGVATVTASTQMADPIYPLLIATDSEAAAVQLTEA